MTTFYTPPEMQGQIVEVSFAGIGEDGALCRRIDYALAAGSRGASYTVHQWLDTEQQFDPWNADPRGVSCEAAGTPITTTEAEQLMGDADEDAERTYRAECAAEDYAA